MAYCSIHTVSYLVLGRQTNNKKEKTKQNKQKNVSYKRPVLKRS